MQGQCGTGSIKSTAKSEGKPAACCSVASRELVAARTIAPELMSSGSHVTILAEHQFGCMLCRAHKITSGGAEDQRLHSGGMRGGVHHVAL